MVVAACLMNLSMSSESNRYMRRPLHPDLIDTTFMHKGHGRFAFGPFETNNLNTASRYAQINASLPKNTNVNWSLKCNTMPSMKLTVEAFIEDGTRDQVKIFIGGAPVTQEFADEIGADGYSKNAVDAVAQAKQWMAASA